MRDRTKTLLIVFVIGIIIFIIGSAIYGGFDYESVNEFLVSFMFYQLYSFVLGYSNIAYFGFLEKRKWKQSETIKRILIGLFGSIIITLIGLFFLRVFTHVVYFGGSFNEFIAKESLKDYQFGIWITLIIVSIFHFIYFYNRYQQNKIKEQKVIAGTASAKFDALKNQLDPHFLFNSLNVLTSLIEENPESAQKFTTALSKVYRYVLEQKNKDLVTVDEELTFAKTYMSLLKMRFEDSIIFEIPEKASDPESRVIPLSLQLLLENAVKHNTITSTKPLHIKIYESDENLVVENNLQLKQIVKKGSGVGLDNIKQRYHLLTKKRVFINQQTTRFSVAIPMLTKQISIIRTQTTSHIDESSYIRAREHVEELKAFFYSLISYVIVIPCLIFIWYRFSSHTIQWFWFPMAGWGIGLVFQAYRVFVNNGLLGRHWERRKIEKFMEEEKNNRWQ